MLFLISDLDLESGLPGFTQGVATKPAYWVSSTSDYTLVQSSLHEREYRFTLTTETRKPYILRSYSSTYCFQPIRSKKIPVSWGKKRYECLAVKSHIVFRLARKSICWPHWPRPRTGHIWGLALLSSRSALLFLFLGRVTSSTSPTTPYFSLV